MTVQTYLYLQLYYYRGNPSLKVHAMGDLPDVYKHAISPRDNLEQQTHNIYRSSLVRRQRNSFQRAISVKNLHTYSNIMHTNQPTHTLIVT